MSTKRKLSNCGSRPKAFWGALIGGLISAGVGAYSNYKNAKAQADLQREQMEQQNRLMREANERNRAQQTAATLNNYASALEDVKEEPYVQYKSGGRRKLRNAGARIIDGGYAIPISNDASLLQGSLHNQINESGKTGIGIKVGNKEIEAENGEVIQKNGDELRVFSAQPMFAGISPAEAVIQGANEDKVFKAQEAIKRRYHLRNGKSTPVERNRAAWGASFTTPDYIGLGTNIGASLLSNIYANKAYNDVLGDINYELPTFTEESYVAGPTKWNNSAQRGEVERTRLNARRDIARNTASSAVGLGRMQNVDTNAMYELNKLWDEKANKETEMRQTNVAREQEVRARNAAAKNQWSQNVANIQNQQLATRLGIQQAKVNSNVGMIQGIGSSIGGFLQSGIDNYQADQARRMQLAASPYGSAERAASMGVDFSPAMMRTLKADAQNRMGRFDSGTKDYNDAKQSYDFWNNQLGANKSVSNNLWNNRLFRRKRTLASPNTVSSYDFGPIDNGRLLAM